MNFNQAKKLAQYHKFTKSELYDMLVEALETYNDDYWIKPNNCNPMFDNGHYFNQCRKWIGYKKEVNDNQHSVEIIVIRILQGFGKFSKVKLPKKIKPNVKLEFSEKPIL
jgi:hypothetical protein